MCAHHLKSGIILLRRIIYLYAYLWTVSELIHQNPCNSSISLLNQAAKSYSLQWPEEQQCQNYYCYGAVTAAGSLRGRGGVTFVKHQPLQWGSSIPHQLLECLQWGVPPHGPAPTSTYLFATRHQDFFCGGGLMQASLLALLPLRVPRMSLMARSTHLAHRIGPLVHYAWYLNPKFMLPMVKHICTVLSEHAHPALSDEMSKYSIHLS